MVIRMERGAAVTKDKRTKGQKDKGQGTRDKGQSGEETIRGFYSRAECSLGSMCVCPHLPFHQSPNQVN